MTRREELETVMENTGTVGLCTYVYELMGEYKGHSHDLYCCQLMELALEVHYTHLSK